MAKALTPEMVAERPPNPGGEDAAPSDRRD